MAMPAATLGRMIRTTASKGRSPATDRDLLRRFADAADQDAFAALVRRHTGLVLSVCRRVLPTDQDAEDACQATFLILARKAGAGRWQTSIANWLFTTARRVARDVRRAADRRAKREGMAAVSGSVPPVDRMTGRELLAVIDEELDRLPPIYREPLLLYYQSELARDEIAARLGVPVGTVKIRLERGRKKLGDALTRRGVMMSAALLTLMATSRVGASPPRLFEAIQAAAAGEVPPAIATLAKGVAVNGFVKKLLLGAVVLTAGAIGFRLAVAEPRETTAGPPPAKAPETRDAPPAKPVAKTHTGRVLTPDGKPVAKATVYWQGWKRGGEPVKPEPVATTGPDGTFAFDPARLPRAGTAGVLVAAADGWAPGWRPWTRADAETTLRLAAEAPIRGRLLNLEGKPVAGAVVQLRSIGSPPRGDWDAVVNAMRLNPEWVGVEAGIVPAAPVFVPEAKTDADGRFEITGVGKDRVAILRFLAPGVEAAQIHVLTWKDFDPASVLPKGDERETVARGFHPGLRLAVYGSTFSHTAKPSHDITGTVTDAATGKPVAGVKLVGTAAPADAFGEPQFYNPVEATTDKDGRYRLSGLPKALRRFIHVQPGNAPYLDRRIEVADVESLKTATADIKLDRCVVIVGTLTDKTTGKSVRGEAKYLPMPETGPRDPADTRLYRGQTGYGSAFPATDTWADTDDDGRFRLRVPRGPGVILARADTDRDPTARYASIRVADEDRKYLRKPEPDEEGVQTTVKGRRPSEDEAFTTTNVMWPLRWENGYAIIDPGPKDTEVKVAIRFDLGATVGGTVVGPDGKPVAGVQMVGAQATGETRPTTVATDAFTAAALDPDRPRELFFVHEGKKFVGTLTVKAGDKAPVVKLQPWGVITGRVLTPDGKPAANALVSFQFVDERADSMVRQKLYQESGKVETQTDKDGRFRLEGLFPGLAVGVSARVPGLRWGSGMDPVVPKSGESVDVGDIKLKFGRN